MTRRTVYSVVDMPLHWFDDHTRAHMFHSEHLGLVDPFIDPAAVFKVTGPEMPLWEQDGVRVKVAAGRFRDLVSPINADPRWATPVDLLDVRISAGATFHWPVENAKNGFVLVLAGALTCAEHAASAPQALVLSPAQRGDAGQGMVALEAGAQGAHAVCFSGLPLREPVVPYGLSIGNSREDIATYAHAFQSGAMGELKAFFIR
ncbi:MAG TPA: pirin-like C-terminal cupin domain-containing protein [Hydrogenophaga sp.]|nr:pirin-like C-terminal cupin domain-containing protein [Hydrogenophaga sp.]